MPSSPASITVSIHQQFYDMFKLSILYSLFREQRLPICCQLKALIHAYVTYKLNTNNGLLCSTYEYLTTKLHLVLNAAAKVICGLRKFDHATQMLYNLHWLPVDQRIIFKIILLVYKARSGEGPKYLLPYSAHHKDLIVGLRTYTN